MLIKFLFPNKEEFKERKIAFVDMLEKICKTVPVSERNIGAWIRVIHFSQPAFILFTLLFGPRWLANLGFIGSIVTMLLFIYLRGCWLSHLEKRICADDINIVDIWIELYGIKIDYSDRALLNRQRYTISIIVGSLWFITAISIYYYRFIK